VREIDPKGRRAVVHVGDIALPATGEAVVKTAIDRFGRLDVLFNNAGMFTPKPFLQVDEVESDRFVDVIQVITVSLRMEMLCTLCLRKQLQHGLAQYSYGSGDF
jgi:NAD(P)-dependent dehydrogenase (short-subunit alcohol dehydrogenase family)